jgi:hypothetical protein
MAQSFYAQSEKPESTMTVGQLIDRLKEFDPAAPIIFRSPHYGAFGSDHEYTIDTVTAVRLERREVHYPAGISVSEETGERCAYEAWTDVFHAWTGVVIR